MKLKCFFISKYDYIITTEQGIKIKSKSNRTKMSCVSELKNYITNYAVVSGKNVCLDIEMNNRLGEIRTMIIKADTLTAAEKAEILKLVNNKKSVLGRMENALMNMKDECVITYKNRECNAKVPTNVSMYETYVKDHPSQVGRAFVNEDISTRLFYKAGIISEISEILEVIKILIKDQVKFAERERKYARM